MAKPEKKLPNPEAFERINYLLFIAHSTILLEYNKLPKPEKGFHTEAFLKERLKEAASLSQGFVKTLREVAKKSVIRLSPNIKHCLCSKCNTLLLPSITSKIRYTRKQGSLWTVIRCHFCGKMKRFLVPKEPICKE